MEYRTSRCSYFSLWRHEQFAREHIYCIARQFAGLCSHPVSRHVNPLTSLKTSGEKTLLLPYLSFQFWSKEYERLTNEDCRYRFSVHIEYRKNSMYSHLQKCRAGCSRMCTVQSQQGETNSACIRVPSMNRVEDSGGAHSWLQQKLRTTVFFSNKTISLKN